MPKIIDCLIETLEYVRHTQCLFLFHIDCTIYAYHVGIQNNDI